MYPLNSRNSTQGPSINATENGATTLVFRVARKAAEVHQYLFSRSTNEESTTLAALSIDLQTDYVGGDYWFEATTLCKQLATFHTRARDEH